MKRTTRTIHLSATISDIVIIIITGGTVCDRLEVDGARTWQKAARSVTS
ncbi:unnamed protein product [Tenebrio molitor]|nr:unnamed protein product [Tenebrio molitor]